MTLKEAEDLLKELRKSCLKDWGEVPGHYNDPMKDAKAQALQFGIWAIQLYSNINKNLSGFNTCVEKANRTSILNKTEKDYLSAVIKPYRERVIGIRKEYAPANGLWISIYLENGDVANTPSFKKDEMYKGMELEKVYKPEQLGI